MPKAFGPYKVILVLIVLLLLSNNTAICYLVDHSAGNFPGEELQSYDLHQFKNKRLLSFDLAAHGLTDRSIPTVISPAQIRQHQKQLANRVNNDGQFQIITNQNDKRMQQNVHLSQLIKQNQQNFKSYSHENIANTNRKNNLNHDQTNSNLNPFLASTLPYVRNPNEENNQDNLLAFNRPFQPNGIEAYQRERAFQWRAMIDEDINAPTQKSTEEFIDYQKKYRISTYAELPFCIVVPTFNNNQNDRYLKNIKSIVMQNYTNYHIVVIDDNSLDQTGQLISQYLAQQNKIPISNYRVIKNQQEMRAMSNLRKAALEYCLPEEIFLVIDGDDELVGRHVLKLFNAAFQQNDAWFVYTNYVSASRKQTGFSKPFPQKVIQSNSFRKYPFITSHLRAFYTQLFRNIEEQDLKSNKGEYFKAANDVAICFPVLQQAHTHIKYIPEITYIYNDNTGYNNHQIRFQDQTTNQKTIRKRPRYRALKYLFQQI